MGCQTVVCVCVCVCVCVGGGGGGGGEEVWGGFACVGVGRCGEGVSRYTDKPNQSYLMLYNVIVMM